MKGRQCCKGMVVYTATTTLLGKGVGVTSLLGRYMIIYRIDDAQNWQPKPSINPYPDFIINPSP